MIYRTKIHIDTMTEATNFVATTTKLPGEIVVVDGKGMRVNAKSILGMLYAMEFEDLWCESDSEIYPYIAKFAIDE